MDEKIEVTLEIQSDQKAWLEKMVEQYDVEDSGKALRILLDYAMTEADTEELFENIRCNHCG